MQQRYWLEPLNAAGLLRALLQFFSESSVAIEIDLQDPSLGLESFEGAMSGPLAPFPREYGRTSRMVVIPLAASGVESLLHTIAPGDQLLPTIGAVQIAHAGELQFVAGDNFHHECISVGPGVPISLLERLVHEGVIGGFYTLAEARRRAGLE